MLMEYLKKGAFFAAIGIAMILFFVLQNQKNAGSDSEMTPISESEQDKEKELPEDEAEEDSVVVVDVKGAVEKPGIYEVQHDTRVNEVMEMAGGFLKKADQSRVNLAEKVQDEMVIDVPKDGENSDNADASEDTINEQEKVNLNKAELAEIETLPGIGPSKAQTIIDHREENGLFQSVDDLLEISGIGEKTLENLEDAIQVP